MMIVRRIGLGVLAAALATSALAAGAAPAGKVNVNTASVEQLQLLPRIGPKVADRIVAFRKANGPFTQPEELMRVRGIGERSFKHLEPYVAVSGETTLTEKVRSTRKTDKGKKKAGAES